MPGAKQGPALPASRHAQRASLDPEPDGIPGTTEDARLLDGLERHQGHFGDLLVTQRNLERADGLPLGQGGDQRVLADDLGGYLASRARRHRDDDGIGAPDLDGVLRALPERRDGGRLAAIEQLDGVVGGVAPVQQLLALVGTRVLARGTQHDGQQTALADIGEITLGRGHEAVAGRCGVPGLEAIHRRVTEQQRIAVGAVGRRRARIGIVLGGVIVHVLREILHEPRREDAQVARGGRVAGLREAFGVLVGRVLHAQGLGLVVHELDEVLGRAADPLGQGHGGIVARLHDHALQEVIHRHLHLGVDEHARARHLPRQDAHRQLLFQRDLLGTQRIEHQVAGHELGQGRLLHGGIDVLGGQHLPGCHVQQQVVARGDLGRLGGLHLCPERSRRERGGHGEGAQQGQEGLHGGMHSERSGKKGSGRGKKEKRGVGAGSRRPVPQAWEVRCRMTRCLSSGNCP